VLFGGARRNCMCPERSPPSHDRDGRLEVDSRLCGHLESVRRMPQDGDLRGELDYAKSEGVQAGKGPPVPLLGESMSRRGDALTAAGSRASSPTWRRDPRSPPLPDTRAAGPTVFDFIEAGGTRAARLLDRARDAARVREIREGVRPSDHHLQLNAQRKRQRRARRTSLSSEATGPQVLRSATSGRCT
jgi:hypothetical protein